MNDEGIRVTELATRSEVGSRTISKLRNKAAHGVSDVNVNRCVKAFNELAGTSFTRADLDL